MADPSLYGAVDVPACWGVDLAMAGVLTDSQIKAILETPLPNGALPVVIAGYAPLPGQRPSAWDMTAAQAARICDRGGLVVLVQHCRKGTWVASEATGRADGKCAGQYARDVVGYPADARLFLDDEAVSNPGPAAIAHVSGWHDEAAAFCLPGEYEGFDPGLSPDDQYLRSGFDCFWGAYGPWNVSVRGVACRQGLTIQHAGFAVDPNQYMPDKLGGVVRAMGRLDLWLPKNVGTADPAAGGVALPGQLGARAFR